MLLLLLILSGLTVWVSLSLLLFLVLNLAELSHNWWIALLVFMHVTLLITLGLYVVTTKTL